MKPELHLFVLWEQARRSAGARILADLEREMPILWKGEMAFRGDPADSYEAFYGARRPVDGHLKVKKCGGGRFLVVIVRDDRPSYAKRWARDDVYYEANERMYDLKDRYRQWVGRKHRVHGTTDTSEFARDVLLLTGHSAEEWERGVPDGIFLNIPASARWSLAMEEEGARLGLSDCRVMLEGKYVNDVFYRAVFKGRPCVVKCSSKCPDSIASGFELAKRVFAAAPEVVAEPLACCRAPAFSVDAEVSGPSLSELLEKGIDGERADRFAADILLLARALERSQVVHRDLFGDNLLLGADGHLKAIDWQLAVDRKNYREDPWVARHWKFRYVVFGVNRELGLGVWNDFHALGKLLARFPQTPAVKAAAAAIAAAAPRMGIAAPPGRLDRFRLFCYGLSLRLQMILRGKRHRKYAQLERRWRTVAGRW